jgi:hypothetical protein
MSRKRTSLDTILTKTVEDKPPAASAPAAPPAGNAPPDPGPGHKKQTAYLKEPVYEQLRRLAFDERHKMHDYLIEGLDRVFRDRGLPGIAELEKGSA